jgi:hypothetical protein
MIEGFDKTSRSAYSEATLYGPERESIRYNGYKYINRISYGELAHPFSRGMVLSPQHELYDLDKDPGEKMNIYENYTDIAEEYQRLIHSIFPERTYEDDNMVFDSKGIDISTDNELIDRLKSLGYIQY